MTFIQGIAILLAYQLVGEVAVLWTGAPIPGPVVGMVLLFLTLCLRRGVAERLDSTASALLAHLSLLFVPAGVGVIVHVQRIGAEWLPLAAALLLSTVLTLAFTAALLRLLTRRATAAPRQEGD